MLKDINVNHEVIRITLELNKNERELISKASKIDFLSLACDNKHGGVTYSEIKDLVSGGILFLENNTNRVYLTELGKYYAENS